MIYLFLFLAFLCGIIIGVFLGILLVVYLPTPESLNEALLIKLDKATKVTRYRLKNIDPIVRPKEDI